MPKRDKNCTGVSVLVKICRVHILMCLGLQSKTLSIKAFILDDSAFYDLDSFQCVV